MLENEIWNSTWEEKVHSKGEITDQTQKRANWSVFTKEKTNMSGKGWGLGKKEIDQTG